MPDLPSPPRRSRRGHPAIRGRRPRWPRPRSPGPSRPSLRGAVHGAGRHPGGQVPPPSPLSREWRELSLATTWITPFPLPGGAIAMMPALYAHLTAPEVSKGAPRPRSRGERAAEVHEDGVTVRGVVGQPGVDVLVSPAGRAGLVHQQGAVRGRVHRKLQPPAPLSNRTRTVASPGGFTHCRTFSDGERSRRSARPGSSPASW